MSILEILKYGDTVATVEMARRERCIQRKISEMDHFTNAAAKSVIDG